MDNSNILKDISVNVPAEYIDDFRQVIETGLQRAKLKAENRKAMQEWWECEQCYLREY